MVALIVARELLVSGLRLAAIERGVVIPASDLGKLKTWAQAVAAAIGGLAAAGAWSTTSRGGRSSSRSSLRSSPASSTRAAPRLLRGPATS